MEKFKIKNNLINRNLQSRYLIGELIIAIKGALELNEVKADKKILNKLQSLKDDLEKIKSPDLSMSKSVIKEDQEKASSIGSRAYILIADFLDE